MKGYDLIRQLTQDIDPFLAKWSDGMHRAGYLAYTTAKRQDCIESFWYFLEPILAQLRTGLETMAGNAALGADKEIPKFGTLLQSDPGWARPLVEVARRHRSRGITAEMFLGCFKTFVLAIEELIMEAEAPAGEKLAAVTIVRRFGDVFETILMGDWAATEQREATASLATANRRLTLQKNTYENILAAISDMVMVSDADGKIIEANAAADTYLGRNAISGRYFWEVLDLGAHSLAEVIQYYDFNVGHEINLFNANSFFHFRIMPLEQVSLASKGYMILLTNVSCLVGQRESLEKTVSERTMALSNREKQFASLFQAAGESILLIDTDLNVVEANQRCGQVFGIQPEKLRGRCCDRLCAADAAVNLSTVIRNLDECEIWEGEMTGRRAGKQSFPMAVTISRIDLDNASLFQILLRDVTRQKELEASLRREKKQMEEMNITLRHVMQSIDRDRKALEDAIGHKVENLLLPALNKVKNESESRVRKGYLDIIRDQLVNLSAGSGDDQRALLLKLTPTEMKICQFVQAGSSTKEIADAMHLALDTIHTHRKNIRKKFGLIGRTVNLYTFLNSSNSHNTESATGTHG